MAKTNIKTKRKSAMDLLNEAALSMDTEQRRLSKIADEVSKVSNPIPSLESSTETSDRTTLNDLIQNAARLGSKTQSDSGATREQTQSDSGPTRQQKTNKEARLGSKKQPDSVAKLQKEVNATESKTNLLPSSKADLLTKQPDPVAKEQNAPELTPGLLPSPDANSGAKKPDSVATRQQKKGNATESPLSLLPSPKTNLVANQNKDSVAKQVLIPRSKHQLNILNYLFSLITDDTANTPMLSRAQIAKALEIKKETLKNAIDRLVAKGLLVRNTYSYACSRGGTVYSIPLAVRKVLESNSVANRNKDSVAKIDCLDSVANTSVSSSLNLNTTTNASPATEELIATELQTLIERFGLNDVGLGSNDLLGVWREGVFCDLSTLKTSLEHLAFYLESDDSEGIQRPKAWLLKQLRRGFYPPPVGFKSFEEIQEEKKLGAAKQNRDRVRKLRRERFEVEFETWLFELSAEKKKEILGNTPAKSDSNLAKALFRDEFSKEFGDVF